MTAGQEVVKAAGVWPPHADDTWFVVHQLMTKGEPMDEIPHLAIPGDGQTLDDRRVQRMRWLLKDVEFGLGVEAISALDEFEAILAARVLLPALPSWVHLVARQPCLELQCSRCDALYDDESDYARHFDSIDHARAACIADAEFDARGWTFIADELLCPDCQAARQEQK